MPTYRAKHTETGEIVEYDEAVPRPEHLEATWRVERVEVFVGLPDEELPPQPVYGGRRIVSRLEFLRLLTPQERIAIRTASESVAALRDYMYLLELADVVDLDSADTQGGVGMLEQAGLIGEGRAEEILRG